MDRYDMTIARRQQVSLEHTPYYHCTTRCVRRAFLCGEDPYTGQNFDHRKTWMEQRFRYLSNVFAIDLLAYAVMSNHYHVAVHIDAQLAAAWGEEEVIRRWGMAFSLPKTISPEQVACWRERLCCLSWYMRCLNEPMARMANREDDCQGRFWEGRFRCQALLDEAALLKCMVYVDLNPIRAGIASTPEASSHTSIKARIERKDRHLTPIGIAERGKTPIVPIRRHDYLSLVDWTGRQLQTKKRGRIPEHLPPILERLGVENKSWVAEMQYYGKWYYRAVGSVQSLERYCKHLGQNWLKGRPKALKLTA